ncbi:hypothetical protein VP01_1663g4 [Puccinia sorghi]|uniref:Pre-mRNA polyadenylation factor Fip1 domain-containing protein n=1 Tax=Puccinia sorghi TaxID=27349 RepID=A0A0L6VGB9_9BASI|nr:hypothetical protein VP01_1663g4 [Puccinia sorghi]
MDDEEAFLYGDDGAPEQSQLLDPAKPTAAQPITPDTHHTLSVIPNSPGKTLSPIPLPCVDQNLPAPSDPVQRTLELASNALMPPEPSPIPLPSHSPEPAIGMVTQASLTPIVNDRSQNPSAGMNVAGALEDEADEDEEEDEQGLLEDSDEDLDIILEGDTSIPPSSRPSTQPMRFETPRDSVPLGRPIEQPNVTTEYKPLERLDLKLSDPASALPLKPSSISVAQSNPSPRNAPQNNSHNRQPTPENFPRSVTPPPEPPAESKPPDLQAENPVIPSGYDDKDGSALMNFDFDALPESEKGWNKPGAHVADWFNYGFDETTWRAYVTKQKRMRKEEGWASNPFAAFALGNIEQAWEGLPAELKDVMMGIIMGNSSGSRNQNHAPQMPPSIPPMMVMNPMMQGLEMGGYAMQGMSNMMAGGNTQMNGGHNPGMNNQHNEGASRALYTPCHERDWNSLSKTQAVLLNRQKIRLPSTVMKWTRESNIIMSNKGFRTRCDICSTCTTWVWGLASCLEWTSPQCSGMSQDHPMFMNGPSYNGMMEMSQMPHLQHIPSQMQQQQQSIGAGPPMNMTMPPGINSIPASAPVNPALAVQTNARSDSPSIVTPVSTSAPAPANRTATPGGSPKLTATSSPAGARGRGARPGGRGRGNAQASAFLAAAAARGRGRVISASNSVTPLAAVLTTPIPSPKINPSVQVSPAVVPSVAIPASSAPPTAEVSADRPSARPVSPLPSNVPTGPRRALPASGQPPRGPRGGTGGYFDKDAAGARGDEGLDYGGGGGGGGGESPRDDRKSMSRRHSHKSEREKSEKDFRGFEKQEDPSERSRSKSRDKEPIDEKESFHKPKSRHRHRARSRSKDPDHRSSRERGEKDKEDGAHKSSKASNGGRRSRRSRRATEGEDREDEREPPHEAGEERDKEKERLKEKERDRDKDKDKDENDYADGDYSAPVNSGSRKRKPKEERSSRSKRERAD